MYLKIFRVRKICRTQVFVRFSVFSCYVCTVSFLTVSLQKSEAYRIVFLDFFPENVSTGICIY